MPGDATPLTPASRADVIQALSYALRFDGTGKAHRKAADFTAQIAAEILAHHLERSGFVIMRKPPLQPPRIP